MVLFVSLLDERNIFGRSYNLSFNLVNQLHMIRCLKTLILVLCLATSVAGSEYADSLRTMLRTAETDTTRSRLHALISLDLRRDSSETSLHHAQQSVRFGLRSGSFEYIAFSRKALAIAFEYNHQPEEALPLLQESIITYERLGDSPAVASLHLHLARVYEDLGLREETRDALIKACAHYDSTDTYVTASYAHNFLGLIYWNLGDYAEAEQQYLTSLKNVEKTTRLLRKAQILNNLGVLYYNWNRYDEALEYYQRSMQVYEEMGEPARAALVVTNLGKLYHSLGQDSLARVTLTRAQALGEETGRRQVIVNAENWLGIMEFEAGQLDRAETHFHRYLDYSLENKLESGVAQAYVNLGRVAMARGHYPQAITYFKQALSYAESVQNKLEQARASRFLGHALMLDNQLSTAHQYLKQALELANLQNYSGIRQEALHSLGALALRNGNSQEAETRFNQAAQQLDSLFNENLQKHIGELRIRHDIQSKDYQITLLEKESEIGATRLARARTTTFLTILASLILLLAIVIIYRLYLAQYRTRRLVEEQRTNLEKLNSQLSASIDERDNLLRILAHDLRGPLGSYSKLLQAVARTPNLAAEDIQSIVKTMDTSATTLYRLVENLLKWAQFQTGSLKVEPELFDLKDLLAEIGTLYGTIAAEKRQKLIIEGSGNLELRADHDMIYSAIRNLVSNAIKFTPEDGEIRIQAQLEDHEIQIEVKDTGIGIPPDAIPHLFTPDKVLRRNGTDGESTTGLGLALVKEFIEQNGGRINVSSAVGAGSTFQIWLPIPRD